MSEQRETREMQYQLSRKLLDLMLKNGFLEPEEYAKIDTPEPVNIFSGTGSSICVKTLDI